jgi:hypothetical protein
MMATCPKKMFFIYEKGDGAEQHVWNVFLFFSVAFVSASNINVARL